jgi:dual specificity phosphatase 12
MTEILENLWLGGLNLIHDAEFLKKNKITHILSVINEDVCTAAMVTLHIKQLVVRVEDDDDAPIAGIFRTCIEFIEEELASGGAVYVHCFMGISRSPTIVAAYLIWKKGLSDEEAIRLIQSQRPIVNPNDGFRAALRAWSAKHH